jgi:heme/copper-type cytochrome/quinol oxidase subunit 2
VASLDQNLVTTQGSILAAFGVAVTLLLSKAEGYRRDYLTSGKQADFDEARRWYSVVITVPIVVLVSLALLSWLGAHHAGLTLSGRPSQDTVLLIAPVLAQLGFIVMIVPYSKPLIAAQPAHRREFEENLRHAVTGN